MKFLLPCRTLEKSLLFQWKIFNVLWLVVKFIVCNGKQVLVWFDEKSFSFFIPKFASSIESFRCCISMGGVLYSLFKVSTFCASLPKSQISKPKSQIPNLNGWCWCPPLTFQSLNFLCKPQQINHKSKMTISSDIGSVLHQPCAVPGSLQSRLGLVR